jgi:DNA-binding response OmpR family regulator
VGAEGEPGRPTVLVVEDEPQVAEVLRAYLEGEGFTVLTTARGADAIEMVRAGDVDLVILDLRLPDVPGEFVATEVRRHGPVPMVMLTAKAGEEDRVRGLQLGADDYVTKPFSPREVVLRVKAVLRRHPSGGEQMAGSGGPPTVFGGGDLVLDYERRRATVRGADIVLTPTEWSIVQALVGSGGRVLSRYELCIRVRGFEFDGHERMIDSHVKNLRRKLELDTSAPVIVETVVGVGYRLGLRPDE